MSLPQNRVSNLIYFLGGRTVFVNLAKQAGVTLSSSTLGSWITRNSLPAKHVATCNRVASLIDKPINWSKFFESKPLTK